MHLRCVGDNGMKIKLDIPLSLSEIAEATSGTLNVEDTDIHSACTDSREVTCGDLFIALCGKHRDGGCFADDARLRGGYVLGGRDADITVRDTADAILKLANLYKHNLPSLLHTVAITGSVGKTTTKELTSRILSTKYKLHSSYQNYNNDLGLMHTLLSADSDTEVLVVELGMNHRGEISRLSRALEPDIALITNIGTAHIGNLGSRESIAAAKLEISDGMKSGVLIVPHDEPLLSTAGMGHTISINSDCGDFALLLSTMSDGEFDFIGRRLTLKNENVALSGKHLMCSLGFALSVADVLGLDASEVQHALRSIKESDLRQRRFVLGKYDIYDDTYSSSPEAAIAVIEALTRQHHGRVSAVLGDMLELGERSDELHRAVGTRAAECGVRKLYLFGELSRKTAEGALAAGMPESDIFINDDKNDLKYTADQIRRTYSGEVLIVKASHALHGERLYEFLKD